MARTKIKSLALSTSFSAEQTPTQGAKRVTWINNDTAIAMTLQIIGVDGGTFEVPLAAAGGSWYEDSPDGTSMDLTWKAKADSGTPTIYANETLG